MAKPGNVLKVQWFKGAWKSWFWEQNKKIPRPKGDWFICLHEKDQKWQSVSQSRIFFPNFGIINKAGVTINKLEPGVSAEQKARETKQQQKVTDDDRKLTKENNKWSKLQYFLPDCAWILSCTISAALSGACCCMCVTFPVSSTHLQAGLEEHRIYRWIYIQ